MFRKKANSIENCHISPENNSVTNDDYYARKFNIKPFSIKVNRISEDEVEKQKQTYTTSKHASNVSPPSSVFEKVESSKRCHASHCNCGCGGIDEEYYKKLFSIRECRISLPKLAASKLVNDKKGKLTCTFVLKIGFLFIAVAVIIFTYFFQL